MAHRHEAAAVVARSRVDQRSGGGGSLLSRASEEERRRLVTPVSSVRRLLASVNGQRGASCARVIRLGLGSHG